MVSVSTCNKNVDHRKQCAFKLNSMYCSRNFPKNTTSNTIICHSEEQQNTIMYNIMNCCCVDYLDDIQSRWIVFIETSSNRNKNYCHHFTVEYIHLLMMKLLHFISINFSTFSFIYAHLSIVHFPQSSIFIRITKLKIVYGVWCLFAEIVTDMIWLCILIVLFFISTFRNLFFFRQKKKIISLVTLVTTLQENERFFRDCCSCIFIDWVETIIELRTVKHKRDGFYLWIFILNRHHLSMSLWNNNG